MEGVQKTKQSPEDGSAVTGARAEEGTERDRGPYLADKGKDHAFIQKSISLTEKTNNKLS